MKQARKGIQIAEKDLRRYYEEQGRSMHHQSLMYETRNLLGDLRWEKVTETISNLGPESFLDVGCAEGFYLKAVAKSSHNSEPHLVGVDLARSYVEKAHRETDADLMVADSNCLPLRDRSFDAVLCSEVLEHLTNPLLSLGELARVCRRWIIITTPTHTLPFYILKAIGKGLFREFRIYEPFSFHGLGGGHLTELRLMNLHHWSEEHGFAVREGKVFHSFGAPPLPRGPYHFLKSVISVLDKLVNALPLSLRRGSVQFALLERKTPRDKDMLTGSLERLLISEPALRIQLS